MDFHVDGSSFKIIVLTTFIAYAAASVRAGCKWSDMSSASRQFHRLLGDHQAYACPFLCAVLLTRMIE